MHARALKLQDVHYGNRWFDEVEDRWNYDDLKADPCWRSGWISVDCLLYDERDDRVYMGITSLAADIFRAYDRGVSKRDASLRDGIGQFVDLGYDRIADPYDAKFHRSLVKWERDGCLYAAIALLHDVDDGRGGSCRRIRRQRRRGRQCRCGPQVGRDQAHGRCCRHRRRWSRHPNADIAAAGE